MIVTDPPPAVSVKLCGALVVPTKTSPKLRLVVLGVSSALAVPVPVRLIAAGELEALLVIVTAQDAPPAAVGLKLTLKVKG